MSDTAAFLRRHEGLRLHPYRDSLGLWTWGYGSRITDRLLIEALENGCDFPLTLPQAEALLRAGICIATQDAKTLFPRFLSLSPLQQIALTSLAYHCGYGELSQWDGLAEAIAQGDARRAADEVLFVDGRSCSQVSRYAAMFPARAHETSALLLDHPA